MASADILRAARADSLDLPWEADGYAVFSDNGCIANCDCSIEDGARDIARAAFIVRACNAHYQMLEALNVVRRSAAWTGLADETKDLVCAAIAAAEAEAGR